MERLIFRFFLVILACLKVMGQENPCINGPDSFSCVKYIKNYDADTITFEIDDVHPLLGNKIPIRLRGIDTPEMKTKNTCEKKMGSDAKLLVAQKLAVAKRIDLRQCSRDKYFRLVCDILLDNQSLADHLLKAQYAYKYDGGTKSKIDWCHFKTEKIDKRLPANQ